LKDRKRVALVKERKLTGIELTAIIGFSVAMTIGILSLMKQNGNLALAALIAVLLSQAIIQIAKWLIFRQVLK
jgi:hypothetical protein